MSIAQRAIYFIFVTTCLLVSSFAAQAQSVELDEFERRVMEAYVAYYGRPADPEGLAYWSNQLRQNGGDMSQIISAFGTSAEFDSRFGSLSDEGLVANLYQQILGRSPDPEGLDFWVGELQSGQRSLEAIALAIFDGVQGQDVATVQNKLTFATEYINSGNANLPPNQLAAITAMVDDSEASVSTAMSEVMETNGSGVDDGPNQPPRAEAGTVFEFTEGDLVSLQGSGTDLDGTITQYEWKQLNGPRVIATVRSQLLAFTAPEVEEKENLTFRLTVTDDDGAIGTDLVVVRVYPAPDVAPPPNDGIDELLIESVSPAFGLEGDLIEIEASGLGDANAANTSIVLAGDIIAPDEIGANSVSFTVPVGASSGPLRIRVAGEDSNTVFFAVTDQGLAEADPEDIVLADDGETEIVTSYLIVKVTDASNNEAEADRIAALVGGEVVGSVDALNWWQVTVDADDESDLQALIATLEADAGVVRAMIDFVPGEDVIDWSGDPALGMQRARNRVEEGAALYEAQVHPSDSGAIRPLFMSLGATESGVDFTQPDFVGYAVDGTGTSGDIAIYAPQRLATGVACSSGTVFCGSHGTNVTGVMAATLGNGDNAGILRALSGSHGGANISVNGGSAFTKLSSTRSMLEAGATVVNWSWGVHRRNGAIDCDGNNVTNNNVSSAFFNWLAFELEDFFEEMASDYPNSIIVSSAGNGATNAGDTANRLPSSVVTPQQIVVGGHSVVETDTFDGNSCLDGDEDGPVRASNSNYGSRVDVSAAYYIPGWQGTGVGGTSFAAPLVSATIALMQSINPNLTPAEIRGLIRERSLPIFNEVALSGGDTDVVTAPVDGRGARLNVEGAIQGAIDSLDDSPVPVGAQVAVAIPPCGFGLVCAEVTERITVQVPEAGSVFSTADIMFIVDVSGSYDDDLSTFRAQAANLITAFSSIAGDVRIGLSSYSDFPISPYGSAGSGDYAFQLDQPLTDDFSLVTSAINGLILRFGADGPESQLEAVYNTTLPATGWRPGSLPVLFLATDASFHDSDDEPAYPGRGFAETIAAVNNIRGRVFGLQSGGNIGDVQTLASATGGDVFTLSSSSAGIVEAIEDALEATEQDLTVELVPFGDFGGFVESIVPVGVGGAGDGDPIMGVEPGDEIEFDVTFSRGVFDVDSTHTFSFRLRVVADGVAVVLDIPVTITLN